jgi:hypothetical protein
MTMTVIIEYNGSYIMGLVMDRSGDTMTFQNVANAEKWAKKKNETTS